MNKEMYKSVLEVSSIHADRLNFALENLKHLLPFDGTKIQNISSQDFLYLELFTNRFAKLQDYMGNNLFDLCLSHAGEVTDGLTVIDKINKLSKYDIVESEALWRELRKARNHISHEYPTQPELTAKYINETIELAPKLLAMHDKIKQFLLN